MNVEAQRCRVGFAVSYSDEFLAVNHGRGLPTPRFNYLTGMYGLPSYDGTEQVDFICVNLRDLRAVFGRVGALRLCASAPLRSLSIPLRRHRAGPVVRQ